MNRSEIMQLILDNVMDSTEVVEYLGITKQRLSDMNRTGKLVAIKKGIYLREDVERRKDEQDSLREKYLRTPSTP